MLFRSTSTVAGAVGASSLLALAGQNVAGSFAIIASPPRIALAVGVAMGPQAELPPRAEMVLAAAVAGATTLLGIALLALA